ncbi:MAG: hypothetical protein J6T22_02350 [Bacteroidales bacterium]|nr:hypothetical protein [Bacteroidales bacterium]
MKTAILIFLIAFLLLMVSIPVWFAIRVIRHPEKDRGMKKVMAEQRGAEYESGMQKFLMVNYLSSGLAWALAALLDLVFHMESFLSMLIPACLLCLVLVIAKWRLTGEFSKAGLVTFAVGLVIIVTYLIVN